MLLIERGGLDAAAVRRAVTATFERRGTHARPTDLAPPPEEWKTEFIAIAAEAGLTTTDYSVAGPEPRSPGRERNSYPGDRLKIDPMPMEGAGHFSLRVLRWAGRLELPSDRRR